MRRALVCLVVACGPSVQPVPVQEPSTAPLVTSSAVAAPSATPRFVNDEEEDMPAGGDRDGDGIPDAFDKCPDVPEDRDGFQDEDGCPDPDNDKDGVLDVSDKCPNTPGRKPDGCP